MLLNSKENLILSIHRHCQIFLRAPNFLSFSPVLFCWCWERMVLGWWGMVVVGSQREFVRRLERDWVRRVGGTSPLAGPDMVRPSDLPTCSKISVA